MPAAMFGAAALALACSFSYSSDSSSNSSKSSSGSSGDDSAQFRNDVEQYTATFVRSGGSHEQSAFLMGLGELARKRGVSDWESDPDTWEAIGRGLAHSDVGEAEETALRAAWADDDAAKQSAMARGLASAR